MLIHISVSHQENSQHSKGVPRSEGSRKHLSQSGRCSHGIHGICWGCLLFTQKLNVAFADQDLGSSNETDTKLKPIERWTDWIGLNASWAMWDTKRLLIPNFLGRVPSIQSLILFVGAWSSKAMHNFVILWINRESLISISTIKLFHPVLHEPGG